MKAVHVSTTGTYRSELSYFTWQEAILVALRNESTQKPTVKRRNGRWIVTLYPKLYAINGPRVAKTMNYGG